MARSYRIDRSRSPRFRDDAHGGSIVACRAVRDLSSRERLNTDAICGGSGFLDSGIS